MFSPATPSYFLTPNYIGAAGAPLPVIDPATLGQVGQYAQVNDTELALVLAAVNTAQSGWKRIDAKTRAQHLHRLANRIETEDYHRNAPF